MVNSIQGGGGGRSNLWADIRQRQQARAPQQASTASPTQSAQAAQSSTATQAPSAAQFKERAQAAQQRSQKLKTQFASVTDKTSKRKQIQQRLDALGADTVKSNSGGFLKRLGRAFVKMGKAMLGSIAKGALNIPKFFNFVGSKISSSSTWNQDFEKYKNYQNQLDQWVANDSVGDSGTSASGPAGDPEAHTDFAAASEDIIDTSAPAGDYLGFNAPTDELGEKRQITAGDTQGAGEASSAMGFLSGAKGTFSVLDGIDGAVDSYDKSVKFASAAQHLNTMLGETKSALDTLYAGDPQSSDHFEPLRATIATLENQTEPAYGTLKAQTRKEMHRASEDYQRLDAEISALNDFASQASTAVLPPAVEAVVQREVSALEAKGSGRSERETQALNALKAPQKPEFRVALSSLQARLTVQRDQLIPEQAVESRLQEKQTELKQELSAATDRYTTALDAKPLEQRKTELMAHMGELNQNMAILRKAEQREDLNFVAGLVSTGADATSAVNGMTNAGAALAGDAITGTVTQGAGGILGAVTSLAAAAKDAHKALASSKRVARADEHLNKVENQKAQGQARTQKAEKVDQAVKLMRKNQAQTRNTKLFSMVKNLLGAAGAIALTVATFAAGAALMATPVGWGLAGVAAVAGLGLAVYSAYKTIKRSDDIAELKGQQQSVNAQIDNLKTQMANQPEGDEKEALQITLAELEDIAQEIETGLMEKDPETAMNILLGVAQQPPKEAPAEPQRGAFKSDEDFAVAQRSYTQQKQAYGERQEAQQVIRDVFNLPAETYTEQGPRPSLSDPPTAQEKTDLALYESVADCQARLKNKLSMFYA